MKLLHDARYAVAAKRVSEGHLATSRAEVAALLELCRELAADAARYRWLRGQERIAVTSHDQSITYQYAELDAEIDTAMNGANR